jgi:DNA primase
MGELIRDAIPGWIDYADRHDLKLHGRGLWRNVVCVFHEDGKPSQRVNTAGGGWICMSCGASGGDTLAYHMRAQGLSFIDAAKALGAWKDGGSGQAPSRPRTLAARDGLELLYADALVMFVVGADIGKGKTPSEADRAAVAAAARRVLVVYEGVNA